MPKQPICQGDEKINLGFDEVKAGRDQMGGVVRGHRPRADSRRRGIRVTMVATAAAMALLATGCGAKQEPTIAAAAGTTTTDGEEARPLAAAPAPPVDPADVFEKAPVSSPPAPPREAAVVPKPKGKFDSVCDYLLGDFTESRSGYRFVADATLKNTGNVGLVVRVVASWDQIGGGPVRARKQARVRTGATRKVGFIVVATSDQINRHQSAGSGCRVRATIIDTFGPARP